jgi:hypothetical protein
MPDQKSTPKRSFLRFSLRSLLILTALVGAFFGGRVSMQPVMAERERLLVEKEQAERARERERWDLFVQTMDESHKADMKRAGQLDELERHLQRSAGNGQYFLGPIPARNRSGQ